MAKSILVLPIHSTVRAMLHQLIEKQLSVVVSIGINAGSNKHQNLEAPQPRARIARGPRTAETQAEPAVRKTKTTGGRTTATMATTKKLSKRSSPDIDC